MKRARPLTSRNLSPSLSLFFFPSFLPLRHISPKPSNYCNEWLSARQRRRQREAVRDWEDRWREKEGGVEERDSSLLFICYECHSSPDPALIGQWRLTAATRCQDPNCSLLSYWLCEGWRVGKWACGLKWKCHSKAALIQSTFLWQSAVVELWLVYHRCQHIQNHCCPFFS